MKYSLSKYILTITIPASVAAQFGTSTISVGGVGSYTESIAIEYAEDQWTLQGDATGGHVFNKSNNRTGSVQVSLNQLSEKVAQFKTLCNIYYQSEEIDEGLTLELRSLDGVMVATCDDCLVRKIPGQAFAATAATQTWELLAGVITFH